MEQSLVSSRFEKEAWKNVTSFNWQPFLDDDLKRRFRLLASSLGPSALPEEKFTEVIFNCLSVEYIIFSKDMFFKTI